ncbi:MAG: YHS domain-containing (seleno)protein [Pseudolabrys sp.]|nr:YHS domain-containing (seleno)protein [Pseudolabrys sp.]
MTAARRQRKSRRALHALAALALCGICVHAGRLEAGTDDRLVVNPATGLAISGVDPVAYFTDRKPRFGRPDMELSREGAVWRFRNEGNRAAFADNPDVYRPRFGGYDPVAIARGTSVPGHPFVWAVTGGRLYLFYDEAARTAFLADPDRVIAAAERQWPDVARTIGR